MMVIPEPWRRPTVTFSGKNINFWRKSRVRRIFLMENLNMDYYVGWNTHMNHEEISRKAWAMREGFHGTLNMLG